MLTRFRVSNFKSLLNLEFKPMAVNLLIGPNNAGKTNLSAALRFLGLTAERTLDAAALGSVGECWNLTNVNLRNATEMEFETDCSLKYDNESLLFNYKLRLKVERGNSASTGVESLSVIQEHLSVSGGYFSNTPMLKNEAGQVDMLHEEGLVRKYTNSPFYAHAKVPTSATLLSQLYELENNPRAVAFRRYLRTWAYYNFAPEALRTPDVLRGSKGLMSNGNNLSAVLFALHNEKPRLERQLIEAVQLLEPKLDLLSFNAPDPDHIYVFVEDREGHRLSARGLSDGTMRFLAIAYVLLATQQVHDENGVAPLIIIEEPENGLYVGHLKELLKRIDMKGSSGQFIFTTHNPYFIDLFDANIEGIHIVKAGHPSSVLNRPDSSKIKNMLDQISLGEMHFREMLG